MQIIYYVKYIVYQGMKTTDNRIRQVIMTDKGKGHLCLFCQKPTGSKNIPICEDCIFDNNIFKSLATIKERTAICTQNE